MAKTAAATTNTKTCATKTCERCRAIESLIREALGLPVATTAIAVAPATIADVADAADLEARVRSLVSLKRAYEQDLPTDDPDTVEHEHKRGIVVGLSIAITKIQSETGIAVDDPTPPRTRSKRRKGDAEENERKSSGTIARDEAREISVPPSPYALALLGVLARRHPSPSTDEQIAVLAGRSRRSSSFTEAMGALREDGLVEGSASERRATPLGMSRLGHLLIGESREPLPSGPKLLALWQSKLERSEARILGAIVDLTQAHPIPTMRVRVADVSRESGYSETSSSFTAALGKLRRLGLVDGGSLRCAEELLS